MKKTKLIELVHRYNTPLYVYDKKGLQTSAHELLKAELPFGYTVCYAAKANTHPEIVKLFDELGLHFDASSTYEAANLIKLGVPPRKAAKLDPIVALRSE